MRIVVDYRPALRARTGVGEYLHQTVRAMAQGNTGDELTAFSSSWKDRPDAAVIADLPNVRVVDRRIPVSVLNFAWHRFGWPPVESVAGGRYDIAHSPHPLLLPSRSAAQLVTIHDLHFLAHPERTSKEIRRDYPALARAHAGRADRIIVSSRFAAGEVRRAFDVPPEKIAVCPAGTPHWTKDLAGGDPHGYLLFLGTLDPRKNIGGLLSAYRQLLERDPALPKLVMAGGVNPGPAVAEQLKAIETRPFAGHVEHIGYVDNNRRTRLFQGARVFVLPSFEEGFGLPALEAMAAGVPVVASNRGALPELLGDAGLLIDPDDPGSLASAIGRILKDPELWHTLQRRGRDRAREFSWEQTARDVRRAYTDAVSSHAHRR